MLLERRMRHRRLVVIERAVENGDDELVRRIVGQHGVACLHSGHGRFDSERVLFGVQAHLPHEASQSLDERGRKSLSHAIRSRASRAAARMCRRAPHTKRFAANRFNSGTAWVLFRLPRIRMTI